MREEQMAMFDDNPEYDEFVEKFKPKKTTDDCYTPSNIYEAVAEWVCKEYGKERKNFVRPFYPGGDYENYEYGPESVVVDNPPFSIITKIVRYYVNKNIPFFLFAPTLTLFSVKCKEVCFLPLQAPVVYENGAVVNTSFITNMDEYLVRTAPDLFDAIEKENEKNVREGKKKLTKYVYPDHVITAAMVGRWSKYGIEYRLKKADGIFISALDAQRERKKSIFGGGLLLTEKAAAERAAAERAALEKTAAFSWELSERERELIKTTI